MRVHRAFFIGLSLMVFACADNPVDGGEQQNPPIADSGTGAPADISDGGEELHADGGVEGEVPFGLIETCRPVRGTNANGAMSLRLAGYLSLAGEQYAGKGSFPGREVVHAFVPQRDGEVTISLKSLSSAFAPALYVLSEVEDDVGLLLGAVESSGHKYAGYLQTHCLLTTRAIGNYFDGRQAEFVTMRVQAGKTYFVVVDSAWSETSGHGTGEFELEVFDATCPCVDLSEAELCAQAECGSASKVDSCGRTSGQYDLFGNYGVDQVACGDCDQGRCDALAHQCALPEVTQIGAACTRIQGTNRDGRAQFRVISGQIDLAGREKLYAYTPAASGPFTVVLRGEGAAFDGALYALSSIGQTPEVTHLSDAFPAGYAEALDIEGVAGQTVYFAVDSAWDEGDFSVEIADATCPCRALSGMELCDGYEPACGGVFRVDSCGVHALNADGSLSIEPCRECAGGLCDPAQSQCVEAALPALIDCEAVEGTTAGGPTLFTNETWSQYGLIFAAGPEAYFTYTAATSGTVRIRLEADFRWYISVYDNTNFSNLIVYADYYYSAADPSVSFQAEAGVTYYIVIDGETTADSGPVKVKAQASSCAD